jgi:dUTP pyrophosphatase
MISKVEVKVKTLSHFKGELPKYETSGASGLDVRAQLSEPVTVRSLQRVLVPTGLTVEIPAGYEIQVRPRSGWAIREGLTIVNAPGTVDSDYRGEIKIGLINLGENEIEIKDQDRVAQLVLCPVLQIQWQPSEVFSETKRQSGGFGSTGNS